MPEPVRRTQTQVEAEVTRISKRTTMIIAPGDTNPSANSIWVPGTEGLDALVEAAAQGFLAGNTNQNIYPMTPKQRNQQTAAYKRLIKAITTSQQEARFR